MGCDVLVAERHNDQRIRAGQTGSRSDDPDLVPARLVLFSLDLGLRPGEAPRLNTQDIDLSNRLRPTVDVRYEHRRRRAKRARIIQQLGKQAGIRRSVRSSMRRWILAPSPWRRNAPHNTVEERMGPSDANWLDVREVVANLVEQLV